MVKKIEKSSFDSKQYFKDQRVKDFKKEIDKAKKQQLETKFKTIGYEVETHESSIQIWDTLDNIITFTPLTIKFIYYTVKIIRKITR